jgi:pimeloyl-ACP methyl ester carboxylesterase
MTVSTMQIAEINGVRMGLIDKGTGEPLVFIHGAGSFECHAVLQQPALTERFRLVHYHRRGYGESELRQGPTSLSLEAADCRAVLDHLGVERAHFAAESSGADVLLQYARDYPETVHSMALLETALPGPLNRSDEFNRTSQQMEEAVSQGDFEQAAHLFYQEVIGPGYRELMDPHLPTGWMDQLASEMDAIAKESDALERWDFDAEHAAKFEMPVLNVVSSNPRPFMLDAHQTISQWIPHAENVELPDSYHCILEGKPAEAASLLADFFSRHPIQR